MHENWKDGQKIATVHSLIRTRCVEYTRISTSNKDVLFKGTAYLRHNPYNWVRRNDETPTPIYSSSHGGCPRYLGDQFGV